MPRALLGPGTKAFSNRKWGYKKASRLLWVGIVELAVLWDGGVGGGVWIEMRLRRNANPGSLA